MTFRNLVVLAIVLLSLCMAAARGQSGPTVYDASTDYSSSANPNGVWSYGSTLNLSDPLVLFTAEPSYSGESSYWDDPLGGNSDGFPKVINFDGTSYYPASVGAVVRRNSLILAPGMPGARPYSHYRFTAPTAGNYRADINFRSVNDTSQSQPCAYILENGTAIGSDTLPFYKDQAYSYPSLTLRAGETIDAVIGSGTDGSYWSDEALLSFTVVRSAPANATPTPPPAVSPTPASVYDAAVDFSAVNNPNGAWSYGWTDNPVDPLVLYSSTSVANGVFQTWTDSAIVAADAPHLSYYNGDTDYLYSYGYFFDSTPPHWMLIAPGLDGRYSHCVWTAPLTGTYGIQEGIRYVDYSDPTVDFYIDGVSLLTSEKFFNAGEKFDLTVGPSGTGYNDEIAFSLTITPISTRNSPPAPATPDAGVYCGLFFPPEHGLAGGSFTATVTRSGRYTAVANWATQQIRLTGNFNASGTSSLAIPIRGLPGASTAAQLTLSWASNGLINGSITVSGTPYTLAAEMAAPRKTLPGPYVFTILPGSSGTSSPQGYGFGFLTISAGGAASMVGRLGDGQPFSTSSRITRIDGMPLYANPYRSAGYGITAILPCYQLAMDFGDAKATLNWAGPPAGPFTGGFQTRATLWVDAMQVVYPLPVQINIESSGGDLVAPLSRFINVWPVEGFFPVSAGQAGNTAITISPQTDLFFGKFFDPAPRRIVPFVGIISSGQSMGLGQFRSGDSVGAVSFIYPYWAY